jgi:hypothetical protein
VVDALVEDSRYAQDTNVWTVHDELELVRVLGGLQWLNPSFTLWYRGEGAYIASAEELPRRHRRSAAEDETTQGMAWIDRKAECDRALRDRGPLARAAILQHSGCPTSLLDVTASYEVACAFAFENCANASHLRVYALPRHTQAVTVLDDADVVLVDLRAELPSYCLRPHVQQAAFIARRAAVCSDIMCQRPVEPNDASLEALCIAHLKLAFTGTTGAERFYNPRKAANALYPPASLEPRAPHYLKRMDGDYLLYLLGKLATEHSCDSGPPTGFAT